MVRRQAACGGQAGSMWWAGRQHVVRRQTACGGQAGSMWGAGRQHVVGRQAARGGPACNMVLDGRHVCIQTHVLYVPVSVTPCLQYTIRIINCINNHQIITMHNEIVKLCIKQKLN